MTAKASVVSVVPTFSPPAQFYELVTVLSEQSERVVVSDDGSPCTSDDLLRQTALPGNIEVIRHRANAGIARGLNDGLGAAQRVGAPWLLTVDQDSMLRESYIQDLLDAATDRVASGERLGALGAEVIEDASGPMEYPVSIRNGMPTTEEVIQTGTLWNVEALDRIGGFDETMGMDAVDAAACLALRQEGFSIGLAHGLRVAHAIGRATSVHIGGRTVMVTGHSAQRRASMLRSRLRLFPAEFAESPRHAVRTIRRVVVNQSLGLVIEDQRWEKAKGTARGLLPRTSR